MRKRIIQFSDCHLFADTEKRGYNQIKPMMSLQKVITQIAKANADLIIASGDISGDHSRLSYLQFIDLMTQHGMLDKLLVLPGNHDVNPLYDDILGCYDLSKTAPIRLGNWMLHGIDTRFKGNLGQHNELDLEAVIHHVESAPELAHLVVCHHHPIDTNSWMDKHEWTNRNLFMSKIAAINQLKLVIYGHIHADIKHRIGQTAFESCPSTCWQWEMAKEFGTTHENPGYKLFDLFDDLSFQSTTMRTL